MSSHLDILTAKQTFEVVRSVEQATRQADVIIELTEELRQQLRQDLDRAACIDGWREWQRFTPAH
jgi:hypothetical protein